MQPYSNGTIVKDRYGIEYRITFLRHDYALYGRRVKNDQGEEFIGYVDQVQFPYENKKWDKALNGFAA